MSIGQLLSDLSNGNTNNILPQSRTEKFLLGLLDGGTPDIAPTSRVECYLKALCEKGVAVGKRLDSLSEEKLNEVILNAINASLATDEDVLVFLADSGMATPVTNSSGEILISSSDEIYFL